MIFELEIVTRTHVPISRRILVERKGENRCRKIDSFFSEAALGNLVKTMSRRMVFAVGV